MRKTLALLAAGALLVTAPAASAHHSAAMFNRDKTVTLKGKLLKYSFIAPHAWISLTAENGQRWDIECTSAAAMRRIGITPDNLKPGDTITIVTNPLRDGRNGGSLVQITLASGETKGNTYTDIPYGQLR